MEFRHEVVKNSGELFCEWYYISINEVRTAVFTRVLRNKATSSAGDAKGLVRYAMHPDIGTCENGGNLWGKKVLFIESPRKLLKFTELGIKSPKK